MNNGESLRSTDVALLIGKYVTNRNESTFFDTLAKSCFDYFDQVIKIPEEGLRSAFRVSTRNVFRQKRLLSDLFAGTFAIAGVVTTTAAPAVVPIFCVAASACLTFCGRATQDISPTDGMIAVVLHLEGHLNEAELLRKIEHHRGDYFFEKPTTTALRESLHYLQKVGCISQKPDGRYMLNEQVEISG